MQRKHVKQQKNELCKSSKSKIKVQKNFLFKNSKNNYLKADYNFFASLSNKMVDRTNAFEECIEEVSREQIGVKKNQLLKLILIFHSRWHNLSRPTCSRGKREQFLNNIK